MKDSFYDSTISIVEAIIEESLKDDSLNDKN